MNKTIQTIAWILIIIGCVILVFFLNKASLDGYVIGTSSKTNYETTGQFGDYIGGVVGTFFALAGTLLIFLTFRLQAKENKRIAFESSFFEMIRLYRENVNELRYNKYKNGRILTYENRQVIRIIFREFIECYREVKKFSNSENVQDYISAKYIDKLKEITKRINPKINIIEMAIIDISYSIMFYGLGVAGEQVIRKSFLKKYNPDYYNRLLYFIKLKPKRSNEERYKNWQLARDMDLKDLDSLIDELYATRNNPSKNDSLSDLGKDFKMHLKYEKYYGGHQFRLGHFFRHLYQSFKYLETSLELTKEEKYSYGKMYRAQLSNFEQALLFINSISSLGMKWEFTPETYENEKVRPNLITTYNLIKNLPGQHLYGIRYKTYYKDVDYEYDEQLI